MKIFKRFLNRSVIITITIRSHDQVSCYEGEFLTTNKFFITSCVKGYIHPNSLRAFQDTQLLATASKGYRPYAPPYSYRARNLSASTNSCLRIRPFSSDLSFILTGKGLGAVRKPLVKAVSTSVSTGPVAVRSKYQRILLKLMT